MTKPRCILPLLLLALISMIALPSWATAQDSPKPESKQAASFEKYWAKVGFKIPDGYTANVTKKEAEEFGKKLEVAFKGKDFQAFSELVKFKPLSERAVEGIANKKFIDGFLRGAKAGTGNLFKTLSRGSYKFKQVVEREPGYVPMFRFIDSTTGAMAFQEWYLVKNAENKILAIDLYLYATAGTFSDTMRRMALISYPDNNSTFLSRLTGKDREIAADIKKVGAFMDAVGKRSYEESLKNFDELSDISRKEKSFQVLRVAAAMNLGDNDRYVKCIREYRKLFPNDPSADFMSMDFYLLNEQYKEYNDLINRLMKVVGEDAQLLALQSVGYQNAKEYEKSRATGKRAIELEPELELPYWQLASVNAEAGDFEKTQAWLQKLAKQFRYVEMDLTNDPAYEKFVDSEQHKKLLEFMKTIE